MYRWFSHSCHPLRDIVYFSTCLRWQRASRKFALLWPILTRMDENVEMDDGNKEDWEDQEWGNKSKSRCVWQTEMRELRSENEMVRTRREEGRWRCSNKGIDDGNGWTPRDRMTKSGVVTLGPLRCYTKARSTERRRRTTPENIDNRKLNTPIPYREKGLRRRRPPAFHEAAGILSGFSMARSAIVVSTPCRPGRGKRSALYATHIMMINKIGCVTYLWWSN